MSGLYQTGAPDGTAKAVSGAAAITSQTINELTAALTRASEDSSKISNRIMWLTFALVGVGLLQVGATVWTSTQALRTPTAQVQVAPAGKGEAEPAATCPVPPCTAVHPYQPNYPAVPH